MSEPATFPTREQIAAALDWWREVGVVNEFGDDATAWLAETATEEPTVEPAEARPVPKAEPADPAPEEIVQFGGDPGSWPSELADFSRWWVEEPALDAGGTGPRIAPRGAAGAKLMLIVAEPERDDTETLLSGPHGRLLAGFLAAAGIDASQAYFASALPRAVPMPDWPGLAAAGLGQLLEHHIRLVEPERILVFGRNILPLIGNPSAQDSAVLRQFNHEGRSVSLMGSRGLAELLRSPAARQRFWRRWLEWTDGTDFADDSW